jgi:spore coat protein U-like protein
MRDAVRVARWVVVGALFCAAVFATHGRAEAAPPANCTSNQLVSGGSTDSVALDSSFMPPALAPGTAISAVLSGNCKHLTANSVNIQLGNGTYYSAGFGYRGVFCAGCAGPSPYNDVYYQVYESDGVTPFPAGGVDVACSGNCTTGGGSSYSYTVYFQIVTPNAITSLNDAQIGSYSDATVTATITGSGETTPGTYNNAISAGVVQDCGLSVVTNIGFGAYNPLTVSAPTEATGGIQITCTRGSSGITFAVGAGNNSTHATAPSTRAMVGATLGDYLSYDIFEDSGYATRYPTTAIAESITGGITAPSTLNMYGQIPLPAQNVSADSYSDSVLTTVNF